MINPKLGFSALHLNNKIYVIGGFKDGIRFNTIEEYDISTNIWKIWDVKLEYGLANTASLSIEDDSFLIFGGSNEAGFSLNVYEVIINSKKISVRTKL